jgi:hypothetical protein
MTPAELKAARHSLGLSADGFARLVRVESGRTVRRWESGERDIPGPVIVLLDMLDRCDAARRLLGLPAARSYGGASASKNAPSNGANTSIAAK